MIGTQSLVRDPKNAGVAPYVPEHLHGARIMGPIEIVRQNFRGDALSNSYKWGAVHRPHWPKAAANRP